MRSVSQLHDLFPEDYEAEFVLAGLLALNGDWTRARALFEKLATSEIEQPDIWAFGSAMRAGHLINTIALLEHTGARERWRPLYEALRAVQAGSAQYLRRVAPEIRPVAEAILNALQS